jgi:2-polyprenyl-3-methyl-5-hydroxy-6-metoxy-1,4-benzoquinol methylase
MMRSTYLSLLSLILFLHEARKFVDCFVFLKRRSVSSLSTRLLSHHPVANNDHSTTIIYPSSLVSTTVNETYNISFEERLLHYLARNDTETVIMVKGSVAAKRSLGKQLVFVDLQVMETNAFDDDSSSLSKNGLLCHALLKQEPYRLHNTIQNNNDSQLTTRDPTATATATASSDSDSDSDYYEGYRTCLLPGTIVRVTGTAVPTRNPGKAVLLLRSIQILQLPRQLQHITTILQHCHKGDLPHQETAAACGNWSTSILQERFQDIATTISQNQYPLDRVEIAAVWQPLAQEIYNSLMTVPVLPEPKHYSSKKKSFVLPVAPSEWRQAEFLLNKELSPTLSYTGWVKNRQRFQNNITVVTLFKEDDSTAETNEEGLSCVLHPDLLQSDASVYTNLLAVGAQVQVQGVYMNRDNKAAVTTFVVHHIRLLQASYRPETIRFLLELMASPNNIDLEEAAHALQMSYSEAITMVQSLDATERQWKANQLSIQLQQQSNLSRTPRIDLDSKVLQTLERFRPIAQKYPVQLMERRKDDTMSAFLRVGVPGSRWMSQKKPQLEWMCQQIRSVLESHPEYGQRKLRILDIGGGQGFLANALGGMVDQYIEQIHVVDICARAVQNGATRAHRFGAPVVFEVADASRTLDNIPADVVVALHACGHLSDVALAHAVQRQAGFVIVPCCFNSNPYLKIPSHDETTVEEWLGISAVDWSVLKKLAEMQGDIGLARQAMELICAIRADAVKNQWKKEPNKNGKCQVKVAIRQFPIEYSTRNTVLVGSFVP